MMAIHFGTSRRECVCRRVAVQSGQCTCIGIQRVQLVPHNWVPKRLPTPGCGDTKDTANEATKDDERDILEEWWYQQKLTT